MSLKEQPQLQETELGRLTASAGGALDDYRNHLIGGVVAIAAVIAVALYLTRDRSSEFEDGWSEFASASSAGEFGKVATDFPDQGVAVWGTLFEAEMQFNDAVGLMFNDRAAARSQLKTARKGFDAVLAGEAPPAAKERAALGKAYLLEVTSTEDTEEAVAAYKSFLATYSDSIHKETVEARIKALESQEASDFYAWFDKQNPKPSDRKRPTDGFDPHRSDLPVFLPPIPEELYPADWTELFDGNDEADGPETTDGTEGTESSEESTDADSGKQGERVSEDGGESDASASSTDSPDDTAKPKSESVSPNSDGTAEKSEATEKPDSGEASSN